jgi:hypothetical protein
VRLSPPPASVCFTLFENYPAFSFIIQNVGRPPFFGRACEGFIGNRSGGVGGGGGVLFFKGNAVLKRMPPPSSLFDSRWLQRMGAVPLPRECYIRSVSGAKNRQSCVAGPTLQRKKVTCVRALVFHFLV